MPTTILLNYVDDPGAQKGKLQVWYFPNWGATISNSVVSCLRLIDLLTWRAINSKLKRAVEAQSVRVKIPEY